MPEGTAVASVLFCFGIAQKKGEITNAACKENNWVLFFPTEHRYHQNFSSVKRDTFFSSLSLLCYTILLAFHPLGWCRKDDTSADRTQGPEKILKFESKCGSIREMDAFSSPSFSPCMIQCGSSFSFPMCLSSAGGCSYCSCTVLSVTETIVWWRRICCLNFVLWGQRL